MQNLKNNSVAQIETIKSLLTTNNLRKTECNHTMALLRRQAHATTAAVENHVEEFRASGLRVDDMLTHLMALFAFFGSSVAAQATARRENREANKDLSTIQTTLVACKEAAFRLLRDTGKDPEPFNISFAEGVDLFTAAYTLRAALVEHGPSIPLRPLVDGIFADVERAIEKLDAAYRAKEAAKQDVVDPTELRNDARFAVYDILLSLSRTGFAIFRHRPDTRALFQLDVLRASKRAARPSTDTDAVVPATDDIFVDDATDTVRDDVVPSDDDAGEMVDPA